MEQPANGHDIVSVEHPECVELLDRILGMALDGKINSVALVLVTEPGQFRVVAAGPDVDGMCAGAASLQAELLKVIEGQVKKKKKTILHA